jgi:hypothetical protein
MPIDKIDKITILAFKDAQLITAAKLGIFTAPIISGAVGYDVLKKASITPKPSEL